MERSKRHGEMTQDVRHSADLRPTRTRATLLVATPCELTETKKTVYVILLHPGRCAKYCDKRVRICLSVRSYTSKTIRSNLAKIL